MHMIYFQDAVSGGGRDDDSKEKDDRPASSPLGMRPRGWKAGGSNGSLHTHVHSSVMHKKQTTGASLDG